MNWLISSKLSKIENDIKIISYQDIYFIYNKTSQKTCDNFINFEQNFLNSKLRSKLRK